MKPKMCVAALLFLIAWGLMVWVLVNDPEAKYSIVAFYAFATLMFVGFYFIVWQFRTDIQTPNIPVMANDDTNTTERISFMESSFTYGTIPTENCSICLEVIKIADSIQFPCGHVYHKKCAEQNLQYSQVCALCRQDVPCANV